MKYDTISPPTNNIHVHVLCNIHKCIHVHHMYVHVHVHVHCIHVHVHVPSNITYVHACYDVFVCLYMYGCVCVYVVRMLYMHSAEVWHLFEDCI